MPQPDHPAPPSCGGRFEIQSFLGAGGMGTVYEAYDHQRQAQVAIKVMRESSGPGTFRLKQEFRSLAGIVHPNLVTLFELIEWENQWLFTMERVPGVSFSQARRASPPPSDPDSVPPTPAGAAAPTVPVGSPEDSAPLLADVIRVSDALRQLCDGLDYLHELGLAHGDLKPANALITPDGRIVILDFGISRDWRSNDDDSPALLGTPGYLAPERLAGRPADPPSDMFAVGAILFEVLSDENLIGNADPEKTLRASRGTSSGSDTTKIRREILESLCLRLIDPDPEARPTAAEVRDAVVAGASRAKHRSATQLSRAPEASPFVAREAEIESIRSALLDRRPLAPRVVIVSGESGIGKTELMRRILDEQLPNTCMALEGKCYEREHVPYRAMDRLVDSLSSKLLGSDPQALQGLAWADLAVAARMFPVLRRVPEIDRICESETHPDDREPRVQRRAAAEILGRLLTLVAGGRRVILYIDDLHWGDEESGTVLRDLLQVEQNLALAGCHRRPIWESRFLSRLLGAEPIRHLEIQLDALPAEDSRQVARALLGPQADESHVDRVTSEANGNPFLIRELVEFGAGQSLDKLALRSAVSRHVEQLSPHARSVLEVLAVAGRRLDTDLVREATGIGQTFEAAVILLRSQHLVRASDQKGERIEPYHDRIREVIVQGLAPSALASRHADLARALEALGQPDPAILGFHLEGAGEPIRAAECLLRAAETAESSLAPLNAAGHYAKVVELLPDADPRKRQSLEAQARSLSAAGRAASAAPLYLTLAEDAEPEAALALRRTAAEAWVYAGEFDEARAVLPAVLQAAGVREPRTLLGRVWGIARHRLWIWRRRNRYTPVSAREVPTERLVRIDAYETAAELSSTIDLIRAAYSQLARVRECLEVGEPRRVARALVENVVIEGIGGERSSRQGLELLRIAEEACEKGDFPEERAMIRYAAGVHAALNGRYADVVESVADLAHAPDLRRSVRQLRTLRSVIGYSRWWLGEWRTLADEYDAWILDAVERGDQLSACSFRLEQCGQWAEVLEDRPERAAQRVAEALDSPIGRELSFGHLAAKQTRAWIALYMGHADEAERVLHLRGAEKAYLRIQRSRVEIEVLHAFAALARGRRGLRRARSWMRKIDREGLAWSAPVARLVGASIDAQEGRRAESIAGLQAVISDCDQLGFAMFSAAASWRLGELQGGNEGEVLRAAAEERIADQGAKRPDRIVRALAPGFSDALG